MIKETKVKNNNKIFILLPDGVGLRNFAYSDFYQIGLQNDFEIKYWNATPFNLSELGFNEIKITHSKSHPFTEVYKNARKQIELNLFIKKTKDKVYDSYRFPFPYTTLKKSIKSLLTQAITVTHSSRFGLNSVRDKIKSKERETFYFKDCLETLKKEKPAIVFCTNQRPMTAIAPLLAAQDLGIPTATFIFSWDNLPKATMVVETDYYFVWSDLMKDELLFYYPYIQKSQIFVTGTPQFEAHFDIENLISRELFYEQNNLDLNKKYICYSGDDITTCPDDPEYLKDVAEAIGILNSEGYNLGIIFRRCPVDFSDRYNKVLQEYNEIITAISPAWKKTGENWNTILPTKGDVILQANTIKYTEMVVNLGSSMVFDYASYKKPCAFINYDVQNQKNKDWSVAKIYNYIHFRSMPNKETVLWLNAPEEITGKIKLGLETPGNTVENTLKWYETINQHPNEIASSRIWQAIDKIINQNYKSE